MASQGAFSLSIAAFSILGVFLPFFRFYKNLYTDEGYLTFTLPVRRSSIYWSKTLNSMLWIVLTILTVLVCSAANQLIGGSGSAIEEYRALFDYAKAETGVWFPVLIAEGVLLLAALLAESVAKVQFSVTVGSMLAQKHKVIASIGIYCGLNLVLNFLSQAFYGVVALVIFFNSSDESSAIIIPAVAVLAAVYLLMVGAIAFVLHLITFRSIRNRLNL